MPISTDLRVPLTVEDVTRSWGSRSARLASPRMLAIVAELLERAETEHWMQPSLSFRAWPVLQHGLDSTELGNRSRLRAQVVNLHLRGATHLAVGVCTVGAGVETRVTDWFASGGRLRAVVLDEIGTLALYRLADELEALLQKEAAILRLEASGVLNPGEDGFEISEQATVVQLAGGERIGVSVTSTGMLVPRKSLSLLMGFGARMPKWSRGELCAMCGARQRCPHRQQQLAGVSV